MDQRSVVLIVDGNSVHQRDQSVMNVCQVCCNRRMLRPCHLRRAAQRGSSRHARLIEYQQVKRWGGAKSLMRRKLLLPNLPRLERQRLCSMYTLSSRVLDLLLSLRDVTSMQSEVSFLSCLQQLEKQPSKKAFNDQALRETHFGHLTKVNLATSYRFLLSVAPLSSNLNNSVLRDR